jgi:hypothetical protein
MDAPAVVVARVTDCAAVNVPPAGENVGDAACCAGGGFPPPPPLFPPPQPAMLNVTKPIARTLPRILILTLPAVPSRPGYKPTEKLRTAAGIVPILSTHQSTTNA